MSKFVQFNNGTIRRVSGTLGGSSAWKQHADDSAWGDRSGRRRLTDKILGDLAAEQMRDVLANGPERQERKPKHRRHHPAPVVMTVVKARQPKAEARPRIKVVINDSGKMVAVRLN